MNFFHHSAAMQLLSPRLKLWFRLKLRKSVILGPNPHISGKEGLGALDGSVSMPSEYLYDFSCIFRTSLIIIVKNRGGGCCCALLNSCLDSHIDMIAR